MLAEQVLYISPTQGVLRGYSQWPFNLTFLPEDILYGYLAIWILAIYLFKIFMKIGLMLRGERNPLVVYQEAQEGQELLVGNAI